jgi:hypothetical protein
MDCLNVQPAGDDVRGDCVLNPAQEAIVRAAVVGEVLWVTHNPDTGASWLAAFLRDRCGWSCAYVSHLSKITDEFSRGQDVVVDIDGWWGPESKKYNDMFRDIHAVPGKRVIVLCYDHPPTGRELDVTKITQRQGWTPAARICACGGRRWFSDGLCATEHERVHSWRAHNQ